MEAHSKADSSKKTKGTTRLSHSLFLPFFFMFFFDFYDTLSMPEHCTQHHVSGRRPLCRPASLCVCVHKAWTEPLRQATGYSQDSTREGVARQNRKLSVVSFFCRAEIPPLPFPSFFLPPFQCVFTLFRPRCTTRNFVPVIISNRALWPL